MRSTKARVVQDAEFVFTPALNQGQLKFIKK